MTTRVFLSIAAAALLVGAVGCSSSESNSADAVAKTESQAQAGAGTAAPQVQADATMETPMAVEPAFSFAAYDVNGTLQNSSQWIGKQPVVINFWGTWCPPCRKEIPDMVRVYDEYRGKGVEILGLAINDTPGKVVSFAQANRMNWVMLMGDEEIAKTFAPITGVPTTIFLDHNGNEVHRHIGPISYTQLKQAFDALIAMEKEAG